MTVPIFPLHTVLFPGRPLPLHIFEERYRDMIRDCLSEGSDFGVCLILEGKEALGPPAKPAGVGTTAAILNIEHLADGRMILLAEGRRRFRINALLNDREYLAADVEMLPDLDITEDQVGHLRARVEKYARVLTREFLGLPLAPMDFLYFACSVLQIAAPRRQALLEMDNAQALAEQVDALLKRESDLMAFVKAHKGASDDASLS